MRKSRNSYGKGPKLAIALVREELKSRKMSMVLREIGINQNFLAVELNEPIAQLLQLKSDHDFLTYDRIVDEHANKIMNDRDSINQQVAAVLAKLGVD